jgi:spermidine synthase
VSWLGFFYGGNTCGAVIGSLLAGFYLLRVHDTAFATFVAVGLNMAVAAVALLLPRVTPYDDVDAGAGARPTVRASGAWAVYATIALSGMTALSAEVIWTRMLSLLIGATVYTFSLILAVFLLGIGIGSSIGSAMARGMAGLVSASAGVRCFSAELLPGRRTCAPSRSRGGPSIRR